MAYASHTQPGGYGAYGILGLPSLADLAGRAVGWAAGKVGGGGGGGGGGRAGAPPPDVVAAGVANLTGAEKGTLTQLHNQMQARIGQYRPIPWDDPATLTALAMGGPEMDWNPGKDEEKAFKAAFLQIIPAAAERARNVALTPYVPPPVGLAAKDEPWWKAVLSAASDAARTTLLNQMPADTRARIAAAMGSPEATAIRARVAGAAPSIVPLALAGGLALFLLRRK